MKMQKYTLRFWLAGVGLAIAIFGAKLVFSSSDIRDLEMAKSDRIIGVLLVFTGGSQAGRVIGEYYGRKEIDKK